MCVGTFHLLTENRGISFETKYTESLYWMNNKNPGPERSKDARPYTIRRRLLIRNCGRIRRIDIELENDFLFYHQLISNDNPLTSHGFFIEMKKPHFSKMRNGARKIQTLTTSITDKHSAFS